MSTPLDRTAGLLAFVRTAETGSFSAAARISGTTPSAVSKSVERLEKRLSVRLFRRSTRSLSLTSEGADYYERVAPLLRELEDADEVLAAGGRISGRLRVSLPGVLAPVLVDAITARFMPRHPELHLDLSISDRFVDLVRDGFDLALRAGQAENADWIVRSLGRLPLVLVASPGYVERAGLPSMPAELREHAHVRYRPGTLPYPVTFASGESLSPPGIFDTDSGMAMRTAALNGAGIAQLLRIAVEQDIRNGTLVEILPDHPLATVPFQALHAFGRVPPLRVRAFSDFVAEALFAQGS